MMLDSTTCKGELEGIANCLLPTIDSNLVTVIFYLIVGFIVFEFLLTRVLDYLNTLNWSEKLP
ncbi:hypothetical protein EOM39_07435, partial [Candidatus Gracilibacteria bacterium]|nr:hypothetical protein [Candidatus Gracilibacteria bacterium]